MWSLEDRAEIDPSGEQDEEGSVKMDSGISGGGSDTPTSPLSKNEENGGKKPPATSAAVDMERKGKKKALLNDQAKGEEGNTVRYSLGPLL